MDVRHTEKRRFLTNYVLVSKCPPNTKYKQSVNKLLLLRGYQMTPCDAYTSKTTFSSGCWQRLPLWEAIWFFFDLERFSLLKIFKTTTRLPNWLAVISAGADGFCKDKKGVFPDPNDCAGIITCNNNKAHKQSCANPLLLNAKSMNCDLPYRVDCGSRPVRNSDASGKWSFVTTLRSFTNAKKKEMILS